MNAESFDHLKKCVPEKKDFVKLTLERKFTISMKMSGEVLHLNF